MTDKYTPLYDLLAAAARRGDVAVQLRLDDIAKLVGGLPASAHDHRAWWANGSHAHAAAWLDAGWNVAVVSQPDGFVRFERNRAELGGRTLASSRRAGGRSEMPRGLRNAVIDAATLPVLEKTAVRVTLEWRDAGPIGLDSGGGLAFPRLPSLVCIG
jgi:hypothetical protein